MTKLCGARTRSGQPCKAPAMANGRCRMHGGATPRGPEHGAFKHGRYSQVLPARIGERYEQAMTDPALLSLHSEIALIDARIGELLSRIDHGESASLWLDATTTFDDFKTARAKGDAEGMADALERLGRQLQLGRHNALSWREVEDLLDQRRRLVESERKRLVEMQVTMDVRQAMTFVTAVLDTVRRHVTDKRQLAAIGSDLQTLLAVEGSVSRLANPD